MWLVTPPARRTEKLYFPQKARGAWRSYAPRLTGFHPEFVKAIERSQPYHRVHVIEEDALTVLYAMGVHDKHHAPIVVGGHTFGAVGPATYGGVVVMPDEIRFAPFEKDEVVGRKDINVGAENDLQTHHMFDAAIKGGEPPMRVSRFTLHRMYAITENIVRDFKSLL